VSHAAAILRRAGPPPRDNVGAMPRRTAPRTELVWPGKDAVPPSPHAARLAIPPDGAGLFVRGDNLAAMGGLLRTAPGAIDLVYLDPPFGTGAAFATKTRDNATTAGGVRAYDDAWEDYPDGYLRFMEPRLRLVRELLRDDGSLLLHCDYRAAPYLAVLCDELFGLGDRGPAKRAPGFRNEIVWTYGLGGSSATCYPKKHDTILWYSKGATWTFQPPMTPATSALMRGKLKKMPDVFDDVPSLNNMARERTGYPTQKPLALLERLVAAHTRPGALVADFFCGSGTTLIAAARLGRRFIGCDVGTTSHEVFRARCAAESPAIRYAVADVDAARPERSGRAGRVTS
jgi:DNA modification methylase